MAAMCDAVLVDLIHGCGPTCAGAAPPEQPAGDAHVFLLCGNRSRDVTDFSGRRVHVLDSASTAECLYRFKQTVDELDLSSVRVVTTPRGRRTLLVYQEQLFTAVYTFHYEVRPGDGLTCPGCRGSAHMDSPAEQVHEDVSTFLRQLPALRGHVTVLRSTLIPGRFQ